MDRIGLPNSTTIENNNNNCIIAIISLKAGTGFVIIIIYRYSTNQRLFECFVFFSLSKYNLGFGVGNIPGYRFAYRYEAIRRSPHKLPRVSFCCCLLGILRCFAGVTCDDVVNDKQRERDISVW